MKNFGFANEVTVVAPGSNGKMNELQAALGLLQLKHFESNTIKCRDIANVYRKALSQVPGIETSNEIESVDYNYCYFPILIDENEFGMTRDDLYLRMRENGIYARRYFYPLVSEFPSYNGLSSSGLEKLPISHKVSKKVICLPIYADLDSEDVLRIVDIIVACT